MTATSVGWDTCCSTARWLWTTAGSTTRTLTGCAICSLSRALQSCSARPTAYNPIEKFFGAVKAELKGERRALYQAFDENYHKDEAAAKKLVRACENVPVGWSCHLNFAAWFTDCGFNKIGV